LFFLNLIILKRLDRLKKICDHSQINKDLLLAVLLIDEKNSHEYFGHKYNVSNNIKDKLGLLAKNLRLLKKIKIFLIKT
jgi:hypothetical protein